MRVEIAPDVSSPLDKSASHVPRFPASTRAPFVISFIISTLCLLFPITVSSYFQPYYEPYYEPYYQPYYQSSYYSQSYYQSLYPTQSPFSFTGFNFRPDLVWIKNRIEPFSNLIADIVRAPPFSLFSNEMSAQTQNDVRGYIDSFDANGITVRSGSSDAGNVNKLGNEYVIWAWKKDPLVDGVDIVSFNHVSGTQSSVLHGLGQKPNMIIAKRTTGGSSNWFVYHSSLSPGSLVYLNRPDGSTNDSTISSVGPNQFSFSAAQPSGSYITYVFRGIDGFSKFGSYSGNGSANGPFVYTGFKPVYIMIKNASVSGEWYVYDGARNPYNPASAKLYPSSSSAENALSGETSQTNLVDSLANGFKLRTNNTNTNGSNYTYIYAAFATSSLAYSAGEAGYEIRHSARFSAVNSAHMTRTFGAPTSNNIFTFSAWVKRGTIGGTNSPLFSVGANSYFGFTSNHQLAVTFNSSPQAVTPALYRDPSQWMHVMYVQNSNTITLYVDGAQVATAAGATGNPFNANGAAHQIGVMGGNFFDGLIADAYFIDGQALTPSHFGMLDTSVNPAGYWRPKAYTGTYGNNGFHLDFSDGLSLGKDVSGRGNHWNFHGGAGGGITGGGGGGAYSTGKLSNTTLGGAQIIYQVGAAGAPGSRGGDTFFGRTSGSGTTCNSSTMSVCARGGEAGTENAGGSGGNRANNVPQNAGFSGGTGANPGGTTGGGGGGAAGIGSPGGNANSYAGGSGGGPYGGAGATQIGSPGANVPNPDWYNGSNVSGSGGGGGGGGTNAQGGGGGTHGGGGGGSGGAGAGSGASGIIVIKYTPLQKWQTPPDWNPQNYKIEAIGAGGGGSSAVGARGGGGGGAYAIASAANGSPQIQPGATLSYSVGYGGLAGKKGGDTYLCNSATNCAGISDPNKIVVAKGGESTNTSLGGGGGQAGSSYPTAEAHSGGSGAPGAAGGGGGGAGGTTGSGVTPTGATGGAGGPTGGGAGGQPGSQGGGGRGWTGTTYPGNMSVNSPGWGAGGGGGGGSTGGRGGDYGGGGGGGSLGGTSGAGAPGLIYITYTPIPTELPPLSGYKTNEHTISHRTVYKLVCESVSGQQVSQTAVVNIVPSWLEL